MKKFLILPAVFFCLSFNTIHKNAEKNFFAPSAGIFLYLPTNVSGTVGAGVVTGHLDEVSIDVISENQIVQIGTIGGVISPSKPILSDYVFAKNFDKSSLRLKRMLYAGQNIPNLEFRIYDGVATNPVYKIAYTNAFTGITEQISVNTQGSITWTNSITSPSQIVTYDFATKLIYYSGL